MTGVLQLINKDGVLKLVDAMRESVKKKRDQESKELYREGSKKDGVRTYNIPVGANVSLNDGDKVKKGQVLCEGYATLDGEFAIGRNLKVAFMPWIGYYFEDAIV